jgi:putative ABC transport system permease protein
MPDWKQEILKRLAGLKLAPAREAEIAEELAQHLEDRYRELVAGGATQDEARRLALAELSPSVHGLARSLQRVEREAPQEPVVPGGGGSGNFFASLWRDIRYGARMLRKNPGFTAVAVLTLALGIGANTALFSVVNAVLLNPLPFPKSNQLVALHASKPNFERGSISYPNFLDWQEDNHIFSAMAVYRSYGMSLTGMGDAERVKVELISSDFFSLLGVKPFIGRTFAPGEDRIGAAPVVLISQGLWQRKFGSSRDALGKALTLDGKEYTVAGVVPATFHIGSVVSGLPDQDVYLPIGQWGHPLLLNRGAGLGIHGVARLRPGVTLEQARADMAAVTANLARAFPDANQGQGATLVPLKEQIVGRVRSLLLVLLGAVGLVLVIACVNVANLLLARSMARGREFAIRAALGAGRWRVIRQLLAESFLLAAVGGGFGVLLAYWGTRAALGALAGGLPRAAEVGLDARVLIFSAGVSLLAGIFFSLAPAVKASKLDLHEALKEGGRGASGARYRAQRTFVVAEVAMALVLLIGAGLMVRTLALLWGVDPGFDPHNLLTFYFAFPPSLKTSSADSIRAQCRELDQKLESLPLVQAVSITWGAFPMGGEDDLQFWFEGQPKPQSMNQMNWALSYVVEPQYLKVMGIRLKRGRFFTARDDEHAPPVVVVDDVFVRKFLEGLDPIGKRIHVNNFDRLAEIVGVVAHVKQWGLDSDEANSLRAQVYEPFMQLPDKAMALSAGGIGVVVRSNRAPMGLADSIRRATGEMSKERVVWGVQTMEEVIADSLAARRFAMTLLGAFAALALLLATVGLYGVISYLVGQRTQEIGIRLALGAQQGNVLRSVLVDGMRMTLGGVALGWVASLGLTRWLAKSSLLFGVSPGDPLTFILVSALLTAVALLASYIPARRATKVDPMVALRYE